MRKYLCLLILAVCCVTMHLHAQNSSGNANDEPYARSQKKYTFTMQPLILFNSGLKFDFEMRLGDGPGWLQFSPAVYYESNYRDNPAYYYVGAYYEHYYESDIFRYPFTKLRGGGLDVNYKEFINRKRTFYTAVGLTYTHFSIDYWGWKWHDYMEDGLEYHSCVYGLHTQHINRTGVNWYFGYQIPTRSAFVYDMFWGLSWRHSFSEKDKPAFNKGMFDYGWTGFVLLAGFRIGFGVR